MAFLKFALYFILIDQIVYEFNYTYKSILHKLVHNIDVILIVKVDN